jgi:hypothetical protein
MGKRRYQIDTRVFAVFFVAAMPFVAFGSFIVVNMARASLEQSVGESFEQRAIETKLLVERYVGEQIVALRLIGLDPEVRSTLAGVSKGPTPARLREMLQVRPAWTLLQVIDPSGRILAGTSGAVGVLEGELGWLRRLAQDASGRQAYVGDIQARPGGAPPVLELAYPIRQPDGALLGALRVLVDASDLYGVLAPVRIGRTGHALVVRAGDGIVLASDESQLMLRQPYAGFASLSGAIQGFPLGEQGELVFGKSGRLRGYWSIPEVRGRDDAGRKVRIEPARLVGYAPVDQVPGVQWIVVVEQDLAEAVSPIVGVTRYLWIHFVGVFGTVILLALYFSFKSESPVIDEKLHLHEEHVPRGAVASGV